MLWIFASQFCHSPSLIRPFQIFVPRLSYLPFLLPRLHAFFSPTLIADPTTTSPFDGFFIYASVPRKWHLPLGLLYDIYALSSHDPESTTPPPVPFRLTLNFGAAESHSGQATPNQAVNFVPPTPPVLHDAFINSVKEADFLRSGTAKPIMSLSAADSRSLWTSVQSNDLATYARIYNSLLPPSGQLRNIPLRVHLPSRRRRRTGDDAEPSDNIPVTGSMKVLQAHIPPFVHPSTSTSASSTSTRPGSAQQQPQTLGTALHSLVPGLFPSRRTPVLARPILHGAQVPMSAHLEELARSCGYADGWLGIVIVMHA